MASGANGASLNRLSYISTTNAHTSPCLGQRNRKHARLRLHPCSCCCSFAGVPPSPRSRSRFTGHVGKR